MSDLFDMSVLCQQEVVQTLPCVNTGGSNLSEPFQCLTRSGSPLYTPAGVEVHAHDSTSTSTPSDDRTARFLRKGA